MIAILLFWRWERWHWIRDYNRKKAGFIGGPLEVYWSPVSNYEWSIKRVWKHLVDWREYEEAIG